MRIDHVNHTWMQSLLECLVISYELVDAQRRFVLVTDALATSPGLARAFVRVTFENVRRCVRRPGLQRDAQQHQTTYRLRDAVGQFVVESVRVTTSELGRHLTLDMGHSFGGVELLYSTATAEVLSARATRDPSGQVHYFHADTGDELDFYAPFDVTR